MTHLFLRTVSARVHRSGRLMFVFRAAVLFGRISAHLYTLHRSTSFGSPVSLRALTVLFVPADVHRFQSQTFPRDREWSTHVSLDLRVWFARSRLFVMSLDIVVWAIA